MDRPVRRLIAFACEGATLLGTLDVAAGATGLLIVSGGNEPRMGAHRGMATLAAALATEDIPVFRFDRRGVGDSEGENRGYASSAPDIAAAVRAFRAAQPHLTRLVGFGNCDAASALALFGQAAGFDAILLANPWLHDEADALPPPAAIRAHYARRLRSPAAWRRLLRGGVDLRKLLAGAGKLARPAPASATPVPGAIAAWGPTATIILAEGDATAIAFADATAARGFATTPIATASHGFADPPAAAALRDAVIRAVRQPPTVRPG